MNKITFGCKLVALLIILSFFIYGFRMTYTSIQVMYQWWNISDAFWWEIYLFTTVPLFWLLNITAAYGLFYIKKWCFIATYSAIIFSTLFCGYVYIPFIGKIINNLFSIEHRGITAILLNLVVLCYVGYLHHSYRKNK